jgi:endoglucanase
VAALTLPGIASPVTAAVSAPASLAAPAGPAARAGLDPSTRFYVSPNSKVMQWDAANPGDPREPAIAGDIASQPQAIWFSTWDPATVTSDVQAVTQPAAAAGQTPVLVIYEIPNRDCGGASAGGAPDLSSYATYIQNFAAGLGTGQVVIILEPDSLALQTCLSPADASARDAAIASATTALKSADPGAKVYLDAGHSNWNSDTQQASVLQQAGVTRADGIFSNVSNFMTTSGELTYDKQILADLGNPANAHIVIDTSRNGNGPAPGDPWCDPDGRALGQHPTADTGDPQVDAYLWVKPPGEADGCADPAGTFDPALADALITSGTGSP